MYMSPNNWLFVFVIRLESRSKPKLCKVFRLSTFILLWFFIVSCHISRCNLLNSTSSILTRCSSCLHFSSLFSCPFVHNAYVSCAHRTSKCAVANARSTASRNRNPSILSRCTDFVCRKKKCILDKNMTRYVGLKTVIIALFFPCILCCPVDDTNDPSMKSEVMGKPPPPPKKPTSLGLHGKA